jgi:selenide,water dikinase
LLTGATETLTEAGAVLVGGHTGEARAGLRLDGQRRGGTRSALAQERMHTGDRLVLTKPLGTGTLFAGICAQGARRLGRCRPGDDEIKSSGREALRRHGVTACTDVTGSGLAGIC